MPYDGTNYGGSDSRTTSWDQYYSMAQKNRADNAKGAGVGGGNTGQDIGRAIIGGPVGWVEAAQGKSFLGDSDPFDGTTLNWNMDEDVYNSMSPEEWKHFAHSSVAEQNSFIATRRKEVGAYNTQKKAKDDAEAKLKAEQAARDTAQNDIIKKVQAFADEMNMPVSKLMQVDDFAKALNAQTYQNSMGAGQGAGPGGLSQVNADLNTKSALLGYQQQRQQAGQQAYDQAFGMISNQNMRSDQLNQYNQGLDLQLQQAEAARRAAVYQQGLSQRQNTFGMIGGIAGLAFGGPTGAAAGQSIGSSIGGSTYGSYNPYKYSYPSTAPSGGGGGGLGGTKFGGNS